MVWVGPLAKEAEVKPRTDSQQTQQGSEGSGGPARDTQAAKALGVGCEGERVLECLRTAGTALTVRQVEVRLGGSVSDLEAELTRLVEQRLVSRLNTLVPTYTARSRDAKADAQ